MSDTEKNTKESLTPVQIALRDQQLVIQEAAEKKEAQAEATRQRLAKVRPTGRPKGAKGKLTLLREAVLAKAEDMVLSDWEEVVRTTIDMAKEGNPICLKILWDRVIPSKRAVDPAAVDAGKRDIVINISGLEVKKVMDESVVDAEYVEVEDGDES